MADDRLKLRNIPLNNSTTYSGTDINVFIYRDLAKIIDRQKALGGSFSTPRDNTVTSVEAEQRQGETLSEAFNGSSSGTPAKGQFNPDTGAYQKGEYTNQVDRDYTETNRPVSSFSGKPNQKNSLLNGLGIDSIVAELGSLHSINYSSFREKVAVRTLGRTHARHYTRGQRTIAGTMTFNVLQSHELLRFANSVDNNYVAMLDQIEPFNMLLLFSNEYGSLSTMHLFNVDINTESQNMSIDQIMLSNTMNFYAQDILPMEETGNVFRNTQEMLNAAFSEQRFKSFINEMQSKKLSGLKSLDSSLSGNSQSDKRVQTLLKRSRGLF